MIHHSLNTTHLAELDRLRTQLDQANKRVEELEQERNSLIFKARELLELNRRLFSRIVAGHMHRHKNLLEKLADAEQKERT